METTEVTTLLSLGCQRDANVPENANERSQTTTVTKHQVIISPSCTFWGCVLVYRYTEGITIVLLSL